LRVTSPCEVGFKSRALSSRSIQQPSYCAGPFLFAYKNPKLTPVWAVLARANETSKQLGGAGPDSFECDGGQPNRTMVFLPVKSGGGPPPHSSIRSVSSLFQPNTIILRCNSQGPKFGNTSIGKNAQLLQRGTTSNSRSNRTPTTDKTYLNPDRGPRHHCTRTHKHPAAQERFKPSPTTLKTHLPQANLSEDHRPHTLTSSVI
jgi:hypothetical protein